MIRPAAGFSLVGVLVAAGVGGVVALGIASMLSGMQQGQNNLRFRSQADVLGEEIRSILSSPIACRQTLGGLALNASANHQVNAIRDMSTAPGAVVYERGLVYGDRSLKIADMRLHNYIHDSGFVGSAVLDISFQANQAGVGAEFVRRSVRVRTERDAAHTLTGCVALAKMTDGIWQRVSSNPQNIFFEAMGTGGRVGIGETTPQAALHVRGRNAIASSAPGIQMGMSASSNYASIELKGESSTSGGGFIDFGYPSDDFQGRIMYENNTNSLSLHTGGAQRMIVTNTGDIGVGVLLPAAKLHVDGVTRSNIYRASPGTGASGGYTFTNDANTGLFRPGSALGHVAVVSNGLEVARFLPNGRVGIGTDSPRTSLHVNGLVQIGADTASGCNSTLSGAMRYNPTSQSLEYCDGSAWSQFGGNRCLGGSRAAKRIKIVQPGTGSCDSLAVTADTFSVNCPAANHGQLVSCVAGGGANGASFHCWNGTWTQAGTLVMESTSIGRCSCFSGGTLVTMEDGRKVKISEIKAGDLVRSTSGGVNRVIAPDPSFLNQAAGHFYMRINGESEGWVTNNHPVLTTDGWKALHIPLAEMEAPDQLTGRLGLLQVGDHLVLEGGATLEVKSIETIVMQRSEPVFNLYVDGDHTFFANGVAVYGYVPSVLRGEDAGY